MSELGAEHLEIGTTNDGQVTIEPGYLKYLRSNGFTIEGVGSVHTVPSDSRDMAHIVMRIQTYEYPKNDPKLDYAAHALEIEVCDCWDYRQNSNDVSEGEKPGGSCKHIKECFKTVRAQEDENQESLF